ncbi:SPOR domain-containing protein [Allosphingosinicella flava]|uniref:SPOR domain-containing protein n=1 Tax=Allosphingosinicella flava TaxID=2771430 RepID=A0A7T2GHP6_9SPHN|nr:SPOR domain-containing protein [Sphingosinicella flava]QPQ54049.1 SPOR domain-containing protein [Sphingosinicella flava]
MISSQTMRRGLIPLAALLAPGLLQAQTQTGIGTYTYQLGSTNREDPSTALSRYVRELSSSPQSLTALKGAGAAALRLGDAEAAGGFFARAEAVAPNDGGVKAGIASVLALMGQPDEALRLFADARAMGIPERDVAAYRGLAYDLKGDQAAAQKDYALAILTQEDAPEVERRLALSQAISGNKSQALGTIEVQLRHQDKAAWRTRAFILALTGDLAGANQAVKTAIPAQAAAFAPFLARLATLNPAEKAAAVHLGQMPVTFQNLRGAEAAPAVPAAIAEKPVAPPVDIARQEPLPVSVQPSAPLSSKPVAVAQAEPQAVSPAPVATLFPPAASASRPLQFADVVTLVQDLPAPLASPIATDVPAKAAPAAEVKASKPAAVKKEPVKKTEAAKAAPKKKDPLKEHPARSWVQLASGANIAALPGEYRKLKAKAEKKLASKLAYTVKAGATNRLLVGPFKTAKEAQAFVNDLAKDKVNGFAWTSMAGQEIEKLPAK